MIQKIYFAFISALILLWVFSAGCSKDIDFSGPTGSNEDTAPSMEYTEDDPGYVWLYAVGHRFPIYTTDRRIPLLNVLRSVGAQIEWKNESTAAFMWNETVYQLSVPSATITAGNESENLISEIVDFCQAGEVDSEPDLFISVEKIDQAMELLGIHGCDFVAPAKLIQKTERIREHIVSEPSTQEVRLRVASNPETDRHLEISDGEIPFIQVWELCGADLEWTDEDHVTIKFGNVEYSLQLSACTLYKVGAEEAYNYMILPEFLDEYEFDIPFLFPRGKEIYMDIFTANYNLGRLGVGNLTQDILVWDYRQSVRGQFSD